MSLTITFCYLEVVVQYICTVWGTYCDFFRASVFVHPKQIWREAEEECFTKVYFELGSQEFCPAAFSFLCLNDQDLLLYLEGQTRWQGQRRDKGLLLLWRVGWKTENIEKCVREDRWRGKEESWTAKTRMCIFSTPTLLPGFLLSAEEKCCLS